MNESQLFEFKVLKRNGSLVDFDRCKIENAISKACDASGVLLVKDTLKEITTRVIIDINPKIVDDAISVESIQDSVEKVLSVEGLPEVAKSYILYRKQHEKQRNTKTTLLDYQETMNKYLNITDWRVKENSTVPYSIGGLILSNSGAVTANYWLSEIYDEDIAEAHKNCDIHIHDLSMLSGYCAGWSLKQLIKEGIGGVTGKITSSPASHLSTLCNQMVNFLGIMQNEWAGAQAFTSFDTYLAPFVKVDNLEYKQVKQCIQSFVYGVNTPSRWGTQAPFTNVTIDWTCPDDMKDMKAIVGGKEMDFTYGDCQKEMDMVNKAFIELMIEGDANGRGFQYPIPTYSITKDFDWSETENNKLLFEMTSKYGIPYFSNYVNSDMDPSDVRSMCPLREDQRILVYDDVIKEFRVLTIGDAYKYTENQESPIIKVMIYGQLKPAKINSFGIKKCYDVAVNGHHIVFSHDHENLVYGGDTIPTSELTTDHYLPFETRIFRGGDVLSFQDGIIVGAFIGTDSRTTGSSVIFNMSPETYIMKRIISIATKEFGADVLKQKNRVILKSDMLVGLIKDSIGGTATMIGLHYRSINRSISFRQGVLFGLIDSAGDRFENSFVLPNNVDVYSITSLISSLGSPTKLTRESNGNRLTLYSTPTDKDVDFKEEDGYVWFKIDSIDECGEGNCYCIEVMDDDYPYFMLPSGLVTHNCRLRLDLRELRKKQGGFFGSGESTGSIGVVTINIPKIAYLSENEDDFFNRLVKIMDISARSLKIKRTAINNLLEAGLYPYTKRYLGTFDNHFSTIGLVGMNEAGLNAKWLRKDMTHKETQEFAKKVLNFMREKLSDYQELYGDLYNLEATPAESTSFRFAKHDKTNYPDIISANMNGTTYYTNSSHLPVGYTEDIFSALDVQDELQTLYTSGTVFHAFLGEKLPDWKSAMNLTRKIAENYKLPYFTFSPTYSVCKTHGYITGESPECPHCGERTEVYSRITGYYRPIQNWNDGKSQEFIDRVEYDINKSELTHNGPLNMIKEEVVEKHPEPVVDNELILIVATTCPKCHDAVKALDEAGISYMKVFGDIKKDIPKKYGVRVTPTLIVKETNEKFVGPEAIIDYVDLISHTGNDFFGDLEDDITLQCAI